MARFKSEILVSSSKLFYSSFLSFLSKFEYRLSQLKHYIYMIFFMLNISTNSITDFLNPEMRRTTVFGQEIHKTMVQQYKSL